ncbi:MAG: ISNCY family transposase [Chloroflexi bacterium]|nr:ISNCY family transposase [Chloroflexota bacterium]
MSKILSFSDLVAKFHQVLDGLPDYRIGQNKSYSIKDAGLGAFSVFFTQSPSFLAHQRTMKQNKGHSNAGSLFGIEQILCDNQIRNLLDPIEPHFLSPMFEHIFNDLEATGELDSFRCFGDNLHIAFDGVHYFSSKNIHCSNCSHRTAKNGVTTYFHSAITPVIVASGNERVIALEPEFIIPQDGHDKQDCEQSAAKRWINKHAKQYASKGVTISGDDLYCKQPFCELALGEDFNFLLVCKPESHKTLYEEIESLQASDLLSSLSIHCSTKKRLEVYTYRYANKVPLRAGEDALLVNWCEVTVTEGTDGKVLYYNTFATNHQITDQTVHPIVRDGRAHWKIENENNNVLKNRGYHLEHNFGHGKKHLSSFLLTLNLLAFLFHVILDLVDEKYLLLRKTLSARQTFFNDIRALLRYICFESWEHLLDFMIEGLELTVPP